MMCENPGWSKWAQKIFVLPGTADGFDTWLRAGEEKHPVLYVGHSLSSAFSSQYSSQGSLPLGFT